MPAPVVLAPDPPVRADGRCAECGKPRRLDGLKAVYRREAERDPFCSAPCARAWHGHPLHAGQRKPRGD